MFKCPKCNENIDESNEKCPYCGEILEETDEEEIQLPGPVAKVVNAVNIVKGAIVIPIAIIITLFFILLTFGNFFEIVFVSSYVKKVCDIAMYIGIALLAISIVRFVIKKSNTISRVCLILAISCFTISIYGNNFYHSNLKELDLSTYKTLDYIEFGSEKIPTLYNILGKDDIYYAKKEEDYLDRGANVNCDLVVFIYSSITSEDKDTYLNTLVLNNYNKRVITVDNTSTELYIKNDYANKKFYVISIDNNSISYSSYKGVFEEIFSPVISG